MIDPRTREIRAILIGWVRYEGIYCMAADSFGDVVFHGLNNGANAARIRGVRELRRQYAIPEGFRRGSKTYSDMMTMLGQRVYLRSSPKALAALSRPFLLLVPPVAVTMEFSEDNQILCCFDTAKSLLAPLRLHYVAKKLRELLPAEIQETAVTMEPYAEEFIKIADAEKPQKPKKQKTRRQAAQPEAETVEAEEAVEETAEA